MAVKPLKAPTYLVKLLPGDSKSPVELELQRTPENVDEYDAYAWFNEDGSSTLDCAQAELVDPLRDMLRSARSTTDSRFLWIEQFCAYPDGEEMPMSQAAMVKSAYEEARAVIVWAGLHSDPDDAALDLYLQPGDAECTKHAFQFAQDLALAPINDIPSILERRYGPTNVHSWAYLYRILCRPFFRGTSFLRTNYASELDSAKVQCAETTLPLQFLLTAAERLFAVCPMPEFICETSFTDDNVVEVLGADRRLLICSVRFGFKAANILVRMKYLLMDRPVQLLESTRLSYEERFTMHLGFCEDLYDVRNEGKNIQDAAARCHQLVTDPASYIDGVFEQSSATTPPSLPFDGMQLPRVDATMQAPFIHPPVNYGPSIGLVAVLPSESVSAQLRCAFIEAPTTACPKFLFVTNKTFIHQALPPEVFQESQVGMPARPRMKILMNEQAFDIPHVQEVFLRLIRQPEHAVNVFLWNMCMYPQETRLRTKIDVKRYLEVRAFMKMHAKTDEVDMFAYLEKAGKERSEEDLESVGLPANESWDAWISKLNEST